MRLGVQTVILVYAVMFMSACSGSPYRNVRGGEVIESRYFTYMAPDIAWRIHKEHSKNAWSSGIWAQEKGGAYHISVENYPLPADKKLQYFDKSVKYLQILSDSDMRLTDNDREQGIGYVRQWTVYAMGMKCTEGAFSRSQGGLMASVSNKNYGLSCGYYHKLEGKRLLSISYRYNYASGEIRHQNDKDTPRDELLTLEQAELNLKLAVKKLITTIEIKNFDRERMEREGLMHYDEEYTLSSF